MTDQIEQPIVTYADVQQKIMLRHPRDQIDDALRVAIEQEDAAHAAAHAAWLELLPLVQAEIDEAEQYNAANPDEQKEVPTLPVEPVLDMSKRRACYKVEAVPVDLELTTENADAKVVYDDENRIAYHHPATVAHSDEHIAAVKLARYKATRTVAVNAIVVTVDGMQFDGDEVSQGRMARAVLLLDTDEATTTWKLADNAVAQVTRAQLKQACVLSATKQTELWFSVE